MRNFLRLGFIDVQPIIQALKIWDKMFDLITVRQDTTGSPHKDTQSIFLRMPPIINVSTIFDSMEIHDYAMNSIPAFSQAIDRVADMAYGKPARAMLVRLNPGGHIAAHRDEGAYSGATERYHLCVTSNDGCEFVCGHEVIFPQPEEVFWFDKHRVHELRNRGSTPRIHLIVDIWSDETGA